MPKEEEYSKYLTNMIRAKWRGSNAEPQIKWGILSELEKGQLVLELMKEIKKLHERVVCLESALNITPKEKRITEDG